MSCNNNKSCSSKWCGWLQSFAQLAVAGVIVYAGYVVNHHMEAWTASFNQGSDDLHNISQAMTQIRADMDVIRQQMDGMNVNTYQMNVNLRDLNQRMDHMYYQVGGVRQRLNPKGMMGSMMPW